MQSADDMRDRQSPRSLRVAILSTCALTTPPRAYGGTELVLAELARELRGLGHRPTVFTTADSTCSGARGCLFGEPIWPPDPLSELRHASAAWGEIAAGDFDVVHLNHAESLPFTRFVRAPCIATIHHERVPELARHYAAYPDVTFAAISGRQAELLWDVPVRAVVHHGLDVDQYPFGHGGDACAFLGRFAASKAPHLAIDAARRAGLPIRLGGEAHSCERAWFEKVMRPRLGPDTELLGEVDLPKKLDLLRTARCLLFPIQWEEPFGLVMIEAMLVGTPVIAFACGSAPEVVEDGITGFLVRTVDEMADKIAEVGRLDRRTCRSVARERWNANRMARAYVALYEDAIERHERAQLERKGGTHAAAHFARAR